LAWLHTPGTDYAAALAADVEVSVNAGRALDEVVAAARTTGRTARVHLCADTAIQLCGARGYSKDTPLEWIYRYARQARLVDGATEVHQQVLARHFMEERGDFWRWA
jgi:alkylation response protein AidB-like acyl-CoA dehydrogenase